MATEKNTERRISLRWIYAMLLLTISVGIIGEIPPMRARWVTPYRLELMVNGVKRWALVYPGKDAFTTPAPVVFSFHGFTGHATDLTMKMHERWPEATVVYPQGMDVLKPSTGQWFPGWPDKVGNPDKYGNRDLHFVDRLLAEMPQILAVDTNRIYATGFSNGATFCYVLLTQRPTPFAAIAGVSGPATFLGSATVAKPLMTVNGLKDNFVYPELADTMQQEFMRINHSSPTPVEWQPGYTIYPPADSSGAPFVWSRPDVAHGMPPEMVKGIAEHIVLFFKEHTRNGG